MIAVRVQTDDVVVVGYGVELVEDHVGTLPGSVQHAQLVRQWPEDVVFFARSHDLTAAERVRLEARGVQVVAGEVVRLVVEADRLTDVERAVDRTARAR